MTPVQRRVKQTDEKVAEQPGEACRARHDVTLNNAFNALCPVCRVRYDSTVFYLISTQ